MCRGRVEASRFRTWAMAIFAWAFLIFWISGLTAALTGAACGKDRYEGAKKLRFCTISLVASRGFELSPVQKAKGAFLHLERGIALAQLEREEEARIAFARAIENARGADGPWGEQLRERMDRLNDPRAVALWQDALGAAE